MRTVRKKVSKIKDVSNKVPWYKYCTVMGEMFVPGKLTDDYAKRQVELAKRLKCDVLFYFIQSEGYALWKSKAVPKLPELEDRDLVHELVRATHAAGMKFVAAWYGMHCQTIQLKEHPEWQVWDVNAVDKPSGSIVNTSIQLNGVFCLNSPFRKYLLSQVREVISNYEVDAIYFDGVYAPPKHCYCPNCREKFRQLYEREIPKNQDDKQLIEFRLGTTASFVKDVRELINEVAPHVVFVIDTHGAIIGHIDSGEPIRQYAPYVDVLILESYWEIIREPVYYVGMESRLVAAETKKTVWCPKWIARNPDREPVALSGKELRLWAMEALGSGASPMSVQQGVFEVSKSAIEPLSMVLSDGQKLKSNLVQARPIRYAALLHSIATKEYRLPKHVRQFGQ